MKITQLDLFSGIGGFHLGFEKAGYEVTSFFSEIDKHAIAVYKHQFPNSTYVGSVTNVRGSELPQIDLITFGSPCQDFSLAGKRKGMEGDRSSLVLEAIRLIGECRPRVFVWENVKGTFSSNNGEDFAAILQAFTNIGGYRLEWQLLNTSWFLPQNRERIYLVGYSTEPKRGWRGVFPIGEDGGAVASAKIKQIGTRLDSGGIQPYQQDRVYDADGIVPALNQGKSDLILRVKSATSQGYEIAEQGDSINLSQPNSETRRGRVGKQKAQTLETSCNQAVVESYRIRRLTPIECERLQGFPDNHTAFGNYDGEVKPMSNTQRYKQCGNAVTVDVVQAVANQCKPLFK
jgi:DNA (cytosine-5)-methyltransferase 1